MKKLQTLLGALTLGGAMAVTPVHAITLTNADLAAVNWNGIDWDSAGTAYTQGFAGTDNDPFTLTYFAWATRLKFDATNLTTPNLDVNADGVDNGYEYTVVAVLDETTTTCVGSLCSFNITGGTFTVYYDLAANANSSSGSLGTGFSDGDILFSGTIPAQPGGSFDTVFGSNSFTVQTLITYTNPLYISPNLTGGTTTGTLQIGNALTGWVDSGGFNHLTWAQLGSEVQLQADGNTIVTTAKIPEPGTLALLGLALSGLGWVRRRK